MSNHPVFIITGASKGLGAAIADRLARDDARLVLVMRDQEMADAQQARFGDQAKLVVTDLLAPDAAETIVNTALQAWGRIDGLVNNAGIIDPIGPLAEVDSDVWDLSIATNLTAPWRLIRAYIAATPDDHPRRIVNISSGAAHRPLEGWAAYCAGKAGLAMLTQSVQLEYGDRSVRAFGLIPGLVDTDMQVRIRASGVNPVSQLPRSALRPASEPAEAAAWLLSGAGDDLAGQEVEIRDPALRQTLGLPAL